MRHNIKNAKIKYLKLKRNYTGQLKEMKDDKIMKYDYLNQRNLRKKEEKKETTDR